ncbi:hypothetical protein [Bifidobacterium parmae]|nr:hypothetical protein [Bifidobacterium parmae]
MTGNKADARRLARIPLETRFRRLAEDCRHTTPDYAISLLRRFARMPLHDYCDEADILDGDRSGFVRPRLLDDLRLAVEEIGRGDRDAPCDRRGAPAMAFDADTTVARFSAMLRDRLLRCDADDLWLPRPDCDGVDEVMAVVDVLVRPLGQGLDDGEDKGASRRRRSRRTREGAVTFTQPLDAAGWRGGRTGGRAAIERIPLERRLRDARDHADLWARPASGRDRTLLDRVRRLQLADCFEAYEWILGDVAVPMRRRAFARVERLGVTILPMLGETSAAQTEANRNACSADGTSPILTRPMGDDDADVNLVAVIAPLAVMADRGLA